MLAALQHILTNLGIHVEIGAFLVLFGLVLTRMISAIVLAPFLGGKSAAGTIKIGFAVIISALLYTSVAPQSNMGEMNTLRVMCLMVKEGVIGATLGFLSQLVFYSVQMAGAMVDYGRGMSQATFLAPQLETNVSLLGQLQFQAVLVLFLILNGHLLFLRAMADSYRTVPLLQFPAFSGGTLGAAEQMARYTGDSLLTAIQLSAPALLALFLVDISFGMLGKVAAGLRVHSESQPVKSLVGLLVVLFALAYILNRMPWDFARMIGEINQLVGHIR